MGKQDIALLIPARRASTRLPDKLLLNRTGLPLILHTCNQAARAFGRQAVLVCVDDAQMQAVVEGAGYTARMTRQDHRSGTDRIAEVAEALDAAIVVNIQADEPEIEPAAIRQVVDLLGSHPTADLATLATPGTQSDQDDPHAVKVVLGDHHQALWFSRAPVVWDRQRNGIAPACFRHVGIYAYRREALLRFTRLPASDLESIEMLEQLRALSAGMHIVCGLVSPAPAGIDVQADYEAFCRRYQAARSPASATQHQAHA